MRAILRLVICLGLIAMLGGCRKHNHELAGAKAPTSAPEYTDQPSLE